MDQWFLKTRNKVKNIHAKETFTNVLDRSMLSEVERNVLYMHYYEKKELKYIADELGYSEQGILKIHKRALRIIKDML